MMNDNDKIDQLIRSAAEDYNRPPMVVPRDEMWAAIEAARTERALRPLHIVAPTERHSIRRYTWLGVAAAAVLLIATGVGIGRWSTVSVPVSTAVQKKVAVAPAAPAPSVSETTEPPAAESNEPEANAVQTSPSVRNRQVAVRDESAVRSASVFRGSSAVRGPQSAPSSSVPYQVATIRHLANAEALLTAFHNDSRDAKMDATLSLWARDLLSNTRLLLDSPAADDPQRAKLLGDLELVLAEIVQLSPGASAQDRGLIEGSIRNGQVMTRLRTAIPAGPTRGL
ncbi:MAG: hypothetical protein ABR582_05895 [Gemmatimonadaceae bacterium]